MIVFFWIIFGLILFSYFGYLAVLWIISTLKMPFNKTPLIDIDKSLWPKVTIFVAAYNEESLVDKKVANTFDISYPKDKLKYLWVTDGSTDKTNEILNKYPEIKVLYQPKRKGKSNAINRGMQHVNTPIVVFSDANSMLNTTSVEELVISLRPKKVGCVAGVKKINESKNGNAVSSGEGFYWNYENLLKKLESDTGSIIGASGELFAIKTELFKPIRDDAILDDFELSLNIALEKYKIKFNHKAIAKESASISIKEEEKRKVRIAVGCFQSMFRMKQLLNPFKVGLLSLKYISHKVIRWTIVPFGIHILPILSLYISYTKQFSSLFYNILTAVLILLALIILIGKYTHKHKLLSVPYYIYFMNLSILKGFFRYLKGNINVNWERAERS